MLGTLQVHDGHGRAVRVGGQRVRALLILLALDAGRVVPAHALIERLWPGDRPADAANALQSLVSRLRAALRQAAARDSVIESSAAGYRLAVTPESVDAVAFETAARAGSRALAAGDARTAASTLREALAAWRGPALADVAAQEFAIAPAARLAELRSTALLDRIEADLALGEDSGLTSELRELTAADPLAERPRGLLMRALAAAGRQTDALAEYARARELLADRLGVDPPPRLEQVYLAILRQEVPLSAPAVAAHPADTMAVSSSPERAVAPPRHHARLSRMASPPTSFIGRDDDVAGVLKKLAEERLVTLTGPGGVGKTRLAAEAAARLGAAAWFTELAPVSEPAEVPYAVLDALGLRERVLARHSAEPGPQDPVDRLCGALEGRDVVLIFDNCEHVVEAAARLAGRLLADCPKARILTTSREPLRINGETLWPVSPLPVPPAESAPADVPEDISAYPAVKLLRDRGAAVQPSFAVDQANAAAVARICRTLDGLPLAIELAAAWLRTLTPAQLAERLDDRFALLTGGSRTALPRHQTLRAVVDWSWNLLSEPERVLARRLAVFPAGATLAAAEQVCADPAPASADAGAGLARAAVLPVLSGLVGKSIVAVTDGPGGTAPRYRMLETVRSYGLERLAEAGEDALVRDALADYYLTLAETADPKLRSPDQSRWFRELAAEQDNINAALRRAISRGDARRALLFVRALAYYWMRRARGEGDALALEVLALEPPPELADSLPIAEARAVSALTAVSNSLALDTVREPLASAVASLSRWAADGATLHPIAIMGEPMLAMFDRDADRALAVIGRYTTSPDPWLRAATRMYRSASWSMLGHVDGAEDDCVAALAAFREIGDVWGIAISLTQLSEFAELRADHATAIAALAEAWEIGGALEAWGDMAYIVGMLAVARARAGDVDEALDDMRQAERVAAERTTINADEWLRFTRAEVAWHAGDLREAASACTAAVADLTGKQSLWQRALRAQAQTRLAIVMLEQADGAGCRDLLAEALPPLRDWVENPPLAGLIDAAGAYAVSRGDDGDVELAATLLGAAHTLRGAFDESSLVAPRLRETARLALGTLGFEAAYARGRELSRDEAIELTAQVLRR